jgi:two-component system, LytTR family, response regulator
MPNLYKAIIVEDEAPARRLLNELLAGYHHLIQLAGEADNGRNAIALINKQRPDLVFLDIQLPDMLGLDVLKELDYKPYVIFTTAYDEYAISAFEALSVDYLLKPLKDESIARALAKLQQFTTGAGPHSIWNNFESLLQGLKPHREMKTLAVKKGGKFTLVQLADIVYFEASDKYTFVHTATGQKLFCDHMLAALQEKLTDDFIRVQKSYIVNRQKIAEIHKYSNNRYTLVLNNRDFTRIVTGPSYLNVINALLTT